MIDRPELFFREFQIPMFKTYDIFLVNLFIVLLKKIRVFLIISGSRLLTGNFFKVVLHQEKMMP
jgi:hypothetical protein